MSGIYYSSRKTLNQSAFQDAGLDSRVNKIILAIEEVTMASLEVTQEELALLKMLLNREDVSTRIEIHHARMSFEFRDYLKSRQKEITVLLDKIRKHLPDEQ
jgi:hypothetical protein